MILPAMLDTCELCVVTTEQELSAERHRINFHVSKQKLVIIVSCAIDSTLSDC